jgi:hypothetical protein
VSDEKGKTRFILLGNEQITDGEWANLAQEVKLFENTRLYKVLFNTMTEHARQRMFEKSTSDADIIFGKAMLYTKSTELKIMNALKSYRPR